MPNLQGRSNLRKIQDGGKQEHKGYAHQKDGAREPENKFETAGMQ
jgi:hypothetical protein